MNPCATPLVTVLIASVACALATPATAELACQAQASLPAYPNVPVSFEALYAFGSEDVSFLWNFGDGSTSTLQNPTHTYTAYNVYRATLTVTDLASPSQTCRDTVEVPVGIVFEPNCWGTASPEWGPGGVQFDCGGRNFPDPGPYSFTWSFGDGSTSDQCSPYHTYAPGTYWAVFWLHTSISSYQCSTVRITAIDMPTAVLQSTWGRLKQIYR